MHARNDPVGADAIEAFEHDGGLRSKVLHGGKCSRKTEFARELQAGVLDIRQIGEIEQRRLEDVRTRHTPFGYAPFPVRVVERGFRLRPGQTALPLLAAAATSAQVLPERGE